MKVCLFTYGTLMCPDIMADVSGLVERQLKFEPAVLHGYIRKQVAGCHYPAIVQPGLLPGYKDSAMPFVQGVLYSGMPPAVWQRLDRYEGSQYLRKKVTVVGANGETQIAMAYVFKSALVHSLSTNDWDFEKFKLVHKRNFVQQHGG